MVLFSLVNNWVIVLIRPAQILYNFSETLTHWALLYQGLWDSQWPSHVAICLQLIDQVYLQLGWLGRLVASCVHKRATAALSLCRSSSSHGKLRNYGLHLSIASASLSIRRSDIQFRYCLFFLWTSFGIPIERWSFLSTIIFSLRVDHYPFWYRRCDCKKRNWNS